MPQRLVLCCDGTWNVPDQAIAGRHCPTNITKLALGVAEAGADGKRQSVFYHRGVGTSCWQRLRGGVFGFGLSRNVRDVYRFIVENYEPGDELFFFGFSRGAFAARSAAGLVRNAGILRRQDPSRIGEAYALYRSRSDTTHPRAIESQLFRRSYSQETRIRFIGVFDTVGALGIPLNGMRWVNVINRRWAFHDTELSTTVDSAFQALAIDEKRRPFAPTMWRQQAAAIGQQLEQMWFTGVHSDVGGGYLDAALADVALLWMVRRAEACGLTFRPGAFTPTAGSGTAAEVTAARPDPMGLLHESRTGLYRLLKPYVRPIKAYDPEHERIAGAAQQRMEEDPCYQPPALVRELAD